MCSLSTSLIFLIFTCFTSSIHNVNGLLEKIIKPSQCYIAPKVCPNSNVTFHLYTNGNPTSSVQLRVDDSGSIRDAKFKKGPIKILIHGYTGHKDYTPNTEVRPAYLQKSEDINVISLDYGPLVKKGCYLQAAENTDLVANCTAQLIENLVKIRRDIQLKRIHVVGLSLGAQVAGQIATYLKIGKLERITSLDAAAPLYLSAFTSDDKEINKGDAKFIDALHTNAGAEGKLLPYADVDFYANGGTIQPGCSIKNLTCSHELSASIFAESINSPNGFLARRCSFTSTYLLKHCPKSDTKSDDQDSVQFGEYVDTKIRGTYFFPTNDRAPYAKQVST